MKNRGISLVEVLVAVAILGVVLGAVSRTFLLGLSYQKHFNLSRDTTNERIRFEDELARLIGGANLHDSGSYFEAPIPLTDSGIQQQDQNSILGAGTASIVLTTTANSPSAQYLDETGQSFESLNSKFGAMGGLSEVALSTVPVGDAGRKRGLFLRRQRPADSDVTQGGTEGLVSDRISEIRFEFYDGSQWISSWDSKDAQKGKLPSLVRVTYVAINERNPRSFLVRLPQSEVAAGGAS